MVHILMATYNGEKYLKEQLLSIENQSYTEWKLYIRDDGSSDNTMTLLNDFRQCHPSKVFILDGFSSRNLGAKANFARLFASVNEKGDYAFCDQDDVWQRDKLEKLVTKLRSIEQSDEGLIPCMVCSDARVIDEDGHLLHGSFVEQSRLSVPESHLFERLLQYNFAQGTSMLWNYELYRIIDRIPEDAIMHDWWIALVAAGHGRIGYIPEQLLSYRQHAGNVLGEFNRRQWHKSIFAKIGIKNWKKLIDNNRDMKEERILQAVMYEQIYSDRLSDRYIEIMNMRRIPRAYHAIKEGYIFLSKMYSVKYYLL